MKRLIQHRSDFWRRLILSYLALMVVIILAFGGYLTKHAQELHTQELSQENLHQLQRVQHVIEENYLNRYELSGLNKAMTTIRSSGPEEINFFLEHELAGNYSKVRSLSNDLSTLKMASPGLESISFYFKRSEIVVDQDYFYEIPANSPSRELLAHIDSQEPHRWFARSILQPDGTEQPLLSYIYTLPYRSKGAQVKGYMIIDLSVREVVGQLQALIQNEEDRYYIFTEQGALAVSNTLLDGGRQSDLSWMNGLLERAGPEGRTTLTSFEGKEVSLSAYQSNLGWTYVSLRPLNSITLLTQELKKKVWIISSMTMLIGLALSYAMSLGFHKRVQGLMLRLQSMLEVQHNKSLYDVLAGRMPAGEQPLPLRPDGLFVAALLQVEAPHTAEALQKQLELKTGSLPSYAVPVDSQRVAVIYCVDDLDGQEMIPHVRRELEHLRIKLGPEYGFAAAMGTVASGTEQIHISYAEAQEAMGYVFVFGMKLLIAYEELEHKQPISMELLDIQALENKLRSGDESLVRQHYAMCRDTLLQSNLTIDAYELLLHHMALALAKVVMDSGRGSFRLTSSEVIAFYRKRSLDETLHHLEQLSLEFVASQKGMGESLYERVALSVKTYIDERLDRDLSLDELADYTSYSKQFIGRVFKEQFNCTIADYMSRRRLELAKKLLSEKSHTIAEVAGMCGFRSVPYFTTKFKQFWGVTPAQFRDQ
ncbi:Two-component response regulator, YesN/AraC family, consists of REC and AraC-type DNA-binding domains [Paenibacillus sp. UNCCL117]|uniref:helix-turn-helix domain-containing protein n=1 Tax=unclassified Paenibacillus TaxID=185978 RepID=UPI0008922EF4|nr:MULTISPECIES: helix-turn-helix domain-containing protein [unclassified Paenibacillus]SDC13030.1 Two-component response regulator, YesN/AraC family, consists of REC and AraC-type DNA-binding domains [Paenibacillus sp. cl123]SFW16949.1 Two-component response regulator, YesN/AraC family, consists of REC and AraC-type DNA-binding domains [Paenibacillus sp. UNCCL117]